MEKWNHAMIKPVDHIDQDIQTTAKLVEPKSADFINPLLPKQTAGRRSLALWG
jgi:hypothetical protein